MTTYTNTITNATLNIALGSPTLGGTDIIRLNNEGTNYTEGLDSIDATAIAEFHMDEGLMGDVGVGSNGLRIQADEMYIESSSPNTIALKGLGSGTVSLVHIDPQTSPAIHLSSYDDITKLRVMAGRSLTIYDSTTVVSAYLSGHLGSAVFLPGAAMTTLIVGEVVAVSLQRDCATVKNYGGIVRCQDASATPAAVEIFRGSIELLGGTITITAGGKAFIDLSRATAAFTITWIIVGDVTIKRPPTGVSWNEPSDAQILTGRVTVID